MATSSESKGVFKQDMVVSTRYRNDLPPPPMPPKLLEIENGGLAQYLTPKFASAMARREEPNIEVDAEGGMPIDMIGIPGYFLGDESAIMAPDIQPVLDPADHALMLTPDQLRNQGSKNINVSFLRRTQYMTSQNARNDPLMRSTSRISKPNNKASAPEPQIARDDPINIKRLIQKGFEIAYPESTNPSEVKALPISSAERDAWRTPVHPDNPRLKPISYYPILPDLASSTDMRGYVSIKFDKPPLPAISGRRDDRVDVALLRAAPVASQIAAWEAKREAHQKNPELYEDPGPQPYDWDFCVPKVKDATERIQKRLNVADPDKNDDHLYDGLYTAIDSEMKSGIEYDKARTYAAANMENTDGSRYMALSLFDPDEAGAFSRLRDAGRAAYYYPISQRMRLKADRGRAALAASSQRSAEDDEGAIDGVKFTIRDPTINELAGRAGWRSEIDSTYKTEHEWLERLKEQQQQQQAKAAAALSPRSDTGAQEIDMDADRKEGNGRTATGTNGDRRAYHNVGGAEDDDDDENDDDDDAMEDD